MTRSSINKMPALANNVAIIGAGAMGLTLLELLVRKGFAVTVFEPSSSACERTVTAGAKCLQDATAVFALDVPVIVCIPSRKASTSTIESLIAAGRRSNPVIEASTLDPT
jgi:3-hydroxyisobutyrate dehydrogenase-like beta-hydroxyacid dehydrogenase